MFITRTKSSITIQYCLWSVSYSHLHWINRWWIHEMWRCVIKSAPCHCWQNNYRIGRDGGLPTNWIYKLIYAFFFSYNRPPRQWSVNVNSNFTVKQKILYFTNINSLLVIVKKSSDLPQIEMIEANFISIHTN